MSSRWLNSVCLAVCACAAVGLALLFHRAQDFVLVHDAFYEAYYWIIKLFDLFDFYDYLDEFS